jgi:hypothetical protein
MHTPFGQEPTRDRERKDIAIQALIYGAILSGLCIKNFFRGINDGEAESGDYNYISVDFKCSNYCFMCWESNINNLVDWAEGGMKHFSDVVFKARSIELGGKE